MYDVIIIGGGASGLPDYREMLANLQTLHVVKESIPKSIQASLSLKSLTARSLKSSTIKATSIK